MRDISLATFSRTISFAGAVLCIALLSVAFAAESKRAAAAAKPDFLLNSDKVETVVYRDSKIKANPALAADCLAEGRKWAERQHRENVEMRLREDPNLVEWKFARDYQFSSEIGGRYINIFRVDTWSNGTGYDFNTILWDREAGRRISIRPFFRETADGGPTLTAMQSAIIAALKAELDRRGLEIDTDANYRKRFEPTLLKIGPVSLEPSTIDGKSSGLVFHYHYSFIGGYEAGAFLAFVPWETLKPYLTAEGARTFGGERPKGSSREEQ